ncbi:MAG: hypothetical protein EPN84_04240 [Legionella sp.]|nr:MAG: hypothetical protein EPN84_04240 [Legionella sp.]
MTQILELAKKIRNRNPIGFFESNEVTPVQFEFKRDIGTHEFNKWQKLEENELIINLLNLMHPQNNLLTSTQVTEIIVNNNKIEHKLSDFDGLLLKHKTKLATLETQKKKTLQTIDSLQVVIANIKATLNHSEKKLAVEEANLNLQQKELDMINQQIAIEEEKIASLTLERKEYAELNADEINRYQLLINNLLEAQKLMTNLYNQAIAQDIQYADHVWKFQLCLGITISLAVISLLCYFAPVIIAIVIGALVTLAPLGLIALIGFGIMANSTRDINPEAGKGLASVALALVCAGFLGGIEVYNLSFLAMFYIALSSAAAAVVSMVVASYYGISSTMLLSTADEHFEKIIRDGLAEINQSDEIQPESELGLLLEQMQL